MNADKRIYFVKPKRYDVMEEVYAAFDSIEKAQQFIGGFESQGCLEIIDGVLNPDLVHNEAHNSYYISLEITGNVPRDIFMCDYSCDIATSRNEEHNICFYGGAENHNGLFISRVYGNHEEDALRKAIAIRNYSVLSGEWDLAWERHKLMESRYASKKIERK